MCGKRNLMKASQFGRYNFGKFDFFEELACKRYTVWIFIVSNRFQFPIFHKKYRFRVQFTKYCRLVL